MTQCQGELAEPNIVLLKKGIQDFKATEANGYRADFWMPAVSSEDSGMYSCVLFGFCSLAASNHSDSLEIWVTGKVLEISVRL